MSSQKPVIAIAGGGPAGAISALCLARLGHRVLLASHSHPRSASRSIPEVLAPEGVHLLEDLGILGPALAGAAVDCPGVVSYWNPHDPARVDFRLTRLQTGYTLDRRIFDANLRRLAREAGVEVAEETQLVCCEPRGQATAALRLELRSRNGSATPLSVSFLLEACGGAAMPAKGMPAKGMSQADSFVSRMYFDRLVAINVAAGEQMEPGDSEASWLQVAPSENGWWYWLKCKTGVACIFLTDGDLLPRTKPARQEQLKREWQSVQERCSGAGPDVLEFAPIDSLVARDARTSCRRHLWRNRWLPLGDAAFTLDPLSGSGITRAIRTAMRAAAAVDLYLNTGETAGLSGHAVAASREFSQALASAERYYAEAAALFPVSRFWNRRVRQGAVFSSEAAGPPPTRLAEFLCRTRSRL